MNNEIKIIQTGSVINITLSRPKVLNALNLNMVREIQKGITIWDNDPNISCVIIEGDGDRAFCAGGDIVSVYHSKNDKENNLAEDFFKEEYILNTNIKNFNKPWVSILDGISMGGGLGLAMHGSHRIVTENVLAAMPETAIGLFPDVGGGHFLSRTRGELGLFLALTGYQLKKEDCLFLGLGTNYILRKNILKLKNQLNINKKLSKLDISNIINNFSNESEEGPLASIEDEVNKNFSYNSINEIMTSLKQSNTKWSMNTLEELKKKSPTSLAVTIKQFRKAKNLEFKEYMIMEYRINQACMNKHDFYEGVRANLVEKDRKPKWSPSSIELLNKGIVDEHFVSLGKKDLFND